MRETQGRCADMRVDMGIEMCAGTRAGHVPHLTVMRRTQLESPRRGGGEKRRQATACALGHAVGDADTQLGRRAHLGVALRPLLRGRAAGCSHDSRSCNSRCTHCAAVAVVGRA